MTLCSKGVARIALFLSVASLLYMTLFGAFHLSHAMGTDGKMDTCPLMPGMNICPMSPLGHASLMQSLLTNIPQQQDLTLALLGLVFITIIGLVWCRRFYQPLAEHEKPPAYFYYQRHAHVETILQNLFSKGILNPKLF